MLPAEAHEPMVRVNIQIADGRFCGVHFLKGSGGSTMWNMDKNQVALTLFHSDT